MRRIPSLLSLAALLAAVAAAWWLATTAPLAGANGPWVYGLLAVVVTVVGVPFLVGRLAPRAERPTTWAVALVMLAFSVVAGFSIGLFFLPAAGFLSLAAVASLFHDRRAVAG